MGVRMLRSTKGRGGDGGGGCPSTGKPGGMGPAEGRGFWDPVAQLDLEPPQGSGHSLQWALCVRRACQSPPLPTATGHLGLGQRWCSHRPPGNVFREPPVLAQWLSQVAPRVSELSWHPEAQRCDPQKSNYLQVDVAPTINSLFMNKQNCKRAPVAESL